MDQRVISGVGNYVKADSLWLSGLSPHRKVDSLCQEEFELLNNSIKRVLRSSYESLVTLDESSEELEEQNSGYKMKEKSSYQKKFLCYGRKTDEDEEEVVREETLDGRTTWWVPTRQI